MQNYLDSILNIAKEAAIVGAEIHESGFLKKQIPRTKSSAMDLVTEIDAETEKAIIEYILERRPDDSVIAEEGNNRSGKSGVCWIIDPLDGTVNYLHSYPAFGISIGVEVNENAAVGVAYDTFHKQIYSAVVDRQAFCGEDVLTVSGCDSLEKALIATGFLPNPEIRRKQCEILSGVLPFVRDIRRSGSPVIDICQVASGKLDGFYEFGLGKWDFAAGIVIARAAGAEITILPVENNRLNSLLVVSTPKIHEQLLDLILTSLKVHK